MKRVFSSPIIPLLIGAALRLCFALKFPAGSGDTVIYEQLATNWLKHTQYAMDIGGQLVSVDIRMPGYPAFLAVVYAITGHTGEAARRAVLVTQAFVDLTTCVLIGALASRLSYFCSETPNPRRALLVGLWLAALCPFTANYVAVPLTETWAIFFTALALFFLVAVITNAAGVTPVGKWQLSGRNYWLATALSGFVVGLGTLFRPEAPLLLVAAALILVFVFLRCGEFKRMILSFALMGFAALPLVPWTIRNIRTLREFQPLTSRDAILPGELDPQGFMAWERTWLYRVRDCYLVPWKLNGEEIRLDDIPSTAFDTPEERERVAAVLDTYNEELTLTPEEDAVFAQLAHERTTRHPLRTYLSVPLRRAVRIWFTPRIELLPVAGNVFPLRYMHEEDPVDQRVTIKLFFLNILYVALGLAGAWRLWKLPAARGVVAFFLLYIVLRTAFLTTLETPEPRYVLVCFPALVALAAQIFLPHPRAAT